MGLCAPKLRCGRHSIVTEIRKLEQIRAKYGSKVQVKILHVEALASIEILSPDVSVPNLLKEFNIETSNEHLARNTALQEDKRPVMQEHITT